MPFILKQKHKSTGHSEVAFGGATFGGALLVRVKTMIKV